MPTTTTKREQLEKLVHDMQALADECDEKGLNAEDQERLVNMTKEFKTLRDAVKAEAEATGTLAEAKDFLAGLAETPEQAAARKAAPGIGAGKQIEAVPVSSLGKAFTDSDAYKSFISSHAVDGRIPESSRNIQSRPMQMPGFKDLVTGASATSAGALVENMRYTPVTDLVGERELTVRDLVTKGTTSSDTVEYVRVTSKTNAAAPTAEATATTGATGTKPESALGLEIVSTTVKTIAHWIPVTRRAIADSGQVRTLVDSFLMYGLKEEEEDQMLSGTGTGENLTGILNSGPLTVGSVGTDLDAIVDAIRTIRVTGRRRPNAAVFHPNDWYSTGFVLAKDSAGNYLIVNPSDDPQRQRPLWGLIPVVSEGMTENTVLVGEFRYAVLWDREQASVQVGWINDQFVRNMLTLLAEERVAFGVLDPQAFCTVTAV